MNLYEEFRKGPNQKRMADLVDDPVLQRAVEITLIESMARMTEPRDVQSAALSAAKIDGAKMAIEILLSLAKPAAKPTNLPPVHLHTD